MRTVPISNKQQIFISFHRRQKHAPKTLEDAHIGKPLYTFVHLNRRKQSWLTSKKRIACWTNTKHVMHAYNLSLWRVLNMHVHYEMNSWRKHGHVYSKTGTQPRPIFLLCLKTVSRNEVHRIFINIGFFINKNKRIKMRWKLHSHLKTSMKNITKTNNQGNQTLKKKPFKLEIL